jgi:lipopolysaccharide/colanic/teichoic acid biosynthesis glycosyltransferase
MTVKCETGGKDFEPGSASRITGIGKHLRKSKMDELPQLINVFKGEMSLVGPRPEVEQYIRLYQERWDKILSVRPGITDPASIRFRNEEELLAKAANPEDEYRRVILPRKLEIYEEYVNNISFINDVKILLGTIFVVLKG